MREVEIVYDDSRVLRVLVEEHFAGRVKLRQPPRGPDGKTWARGAFEKFNAIPVEGGIFLSEEVESYEVQLLDLLATATVRGRFVPYPPHIQLSRYDVGHRVVVVDDAQTGAVMEGTVTERKPLGGGAMVMLSLGHATFPGRKIKPYDRFWVKETSVAAIVPEGDYSQAELLAPGYLRWPEGTAVQVPVSLRRTAEGFVQRWTDAGLVKVYVDGRGRSYHFTRTDLERAGN